MLSCVIKIEVAGFGDHWGTLYFCVGAFESVDWFWHNSLSFESGLSLLPKPCNLGQVTLLRDVYTSLLFSTCAHSPPSGWNRYLDMRRADYRHVFEVGKMAAVVKITQNKVYSICSIFNILKHPFLRNFRKLHVICFICSRLYIVDILKMAEIKKRIELRRVKYCIGEEWG